MTRTKSGRSPDEAEQQIAAQAQPRSTCRACKGRAFLHADIEHDCECNEDCSFCGGTGTVPAGDLARWRDKMRELLGESVDRPAFFNHLAVLERILAAMPAQDELLATINESLQRQLDKVDEALPTWKGTGRGRIETLLAAIAQDVKPRMSSSDAADLGGAMMLHADKAHHGYGPVLACCAGAAYEAASAQDVNAELLGAAGYYGNIPCTRWGCRNEYDHNERLCAPCRLRAAIAQAEQGAAG